MRNTIVHSNLADFVYDLLYLAYVLLMMTLYFSGPILMAISAIIWVWALVDCLRNEQSEGNGRIIWLSVILLLNFLGGLLYFFVRRPLRKAKLGK